MNQQHVDSSTDANKFINNRGALTTVKRYAPVVLVILTGMMLTTVSFKIVQKSDWSIIAAGLSFTGLIAVYLTMLVGRTSAIEKTVVNRTTELQNEIAQRKLAEKRLQDKNEELLATQDELREVNQHLEERVSERTAAIEKLLKQKEDFVSQLGHDLRSPLTPLVGLVPMLREQQKDPVSQELLDVIARNVDYMKHLVEKTLQLASLSSMEDASFDISKVRLSRTVDDLIKRKEYQFSQNSVIVENLIENHVTVAADKLRILEVFDNLASNAIKFMPRGGHLAFDTQINGEFAIVNVRDTGIGISAVQMGHIFDEFYKADQSRHDLNSSGLGLTICRRIIEKHGGGIWAESEGLGKGTVFSFTIPLHVRVFEKNA